MWTHSQAPLDSGYLGMPSLVTLLDLSSVKNRIIYSGSFGLAVITSGIFCMIRLQFTFASNTATIIGGTLVGQQIQLRILSVFVYAFVMSVSYYCYNDEVISELYIHCCDISFSTQRNTVFNNTI